MHTRGNRDARFAVTRTSPLQPRRSHFELATLRHKNAIWLPGSGGGGGGREQGGHCGRRGLGPASRHLDLAVLEVGEHRGERVQDG